MLEEVELVRQNLIAAPGSLDPSFGGGDGITDPGVPDDGGSMVGQTGLLQPDGKIVIIGDRASPNMGAARYNSDGSLDTTFEGPGGDAGFATLDYGANEFALGSALQVDGKILIAGSYDVPDDAEGRFPFLARLNPDGTKDLTFGAGTGFVITPAPLLDGWHHGVVVQPDGRIVASGFALVAAGEGTDTVFMTARYLVDGTLDPSFGTGGIVHTDFPEERHDASRGVILQPDGKLVVHGNTGGHMAAARYLSDGSLDTSFGGDGTVVLLTGPIGEVHSAAGYANDALLQPDGKIILAGGLGRPTDVGAYRIHPNGALDTSFGTGGKIKFDWGGTSSFDSAQSAVLQPDGKFVLAVFDFSNDPGSESTTFEFNMIRFTHDGKPDTTFGDAGRVTTAMRDGADARKVLRQPDGKLLLLGYNETYIPCGPGCTPTERHLRFAVARYIGTNPVLTADFGTGNDGFTYRDDTFRNTNKPTYASGIRLPTGGFSGGGLRVRLGGVDEADITNMSGGWQRALNLPEKARVQVTFRYKLTAPPNLEPDEYGQVLFSVDGAIRSPGPNDYLVQQNGAEGGEGGPDVTTGWRLVTLDLGNLNAGNHTLTFGGFANKKTAADEYNDIVIDDVFVEANPPSPETCSTFTVTQNVYDGPNWWGTLRFRNNGPTASSNYKVEFDVPAGRHCTADYVPPGATLSPLTGSGSSARTVSNHCVFTWNNASPLAVGASKTFNYSTDSNNFSAASNVVVTDASTCVSP